MTILVGALKVIISDVPDSIKLQVNFKSNIYDLKTSILKVQREKLLAQETLFEKEFKHTADNHEDDENSREHLIFSGSNRRFISELIFERLKGCIFRSSVFLQNQSAMN